MPRLKTTNQEKKIETKINLVQSTKDILSKTAKDLKLNQNEIIENLILNFNSQKVILENFNYISARENLIFEIVKQIEKNTNFNNLLLSKIEEQNLKLISFEKSVTSFENKIFDFNNNAEEILRKLENTKTGFFGKKIIDRD